MKTDQIDVTQDDGHTHTYKPETTRATVTPHSPLPWRMEHGYVLDKRGSVVSSVARLMEGGFYLDRDDAAFVCRAVNSHADLLAALKQAIETIRLWHCIHGANDDAWDIYRQHAPEMKVLNAAIAKAEATHEP